MDEKKSWIIGNSPPQGKLVEIEIEHCNIDLNLKNKFVQGKMLEDGFYFKDGSELSFNWNIIAWRKVNG